MSRYAQGAAMMCNSGRFRQFLQQRTGQRVESDQRAAELVRGLCGVASRRELDQSALAGQAWRTLVGEYNQWASAGRFAGH